MSLRVILHVISAVVALAAGEDAIAPPLAGGAARTDESDAELEALAEAHPAKLDTSLFAVDKAGKQLAVGTLVKAQWKKAQLFSGHVHLVHPDGTVDVQFNDGDFEWRIAPAYVVARAGAGVVTQPDALDERPEVAAFSAKLRRALFRGPAQWSAFASVPAATLPLRTAREAAASAKQRADRFATLTWPLRATGFESVAEENEMLVALGLPPRNASHAKAQLGASVCPHLFAEADALWKRPPPSSTAAASGDAARSAARWNAEQLLLLPEGGVSDSRRAPIVRAVEACAANGHPASMRWLALRMLGRAQFLTAAHEEFAAENVAAAAAVGASAAAAAAGASPAAAGAAAAAAGAAVASSSAEKEGRSSDGSDKWTEAHALTMRATTMLYFAALGGDSEASLALGYRHLHGRAVPKECETSLAYYASVADGVADEVFSLGHGE